MLLPILQAIGYSKLEPVETASYPRVCLLRRYNHKEISINIDRDVDRALIVVRIPRKTRNKVAVGDVKIALEIRCAAGATRGSRSIKRKILICPAKFHRYRVRLSVS